MKQYTKNIDGKAVIKSRNEIVVIKEGRQYINPKEELIIADGWEVYVTPAPTSDELLGKEKKRVAHTIEKYDSSPEVNSFYIGDMQMWLDKATRTGLMLRFQAEQMAGQEQTTLWYGAHQFTLPIADAMGMLYALELYASKCYDNTQRHLAAVESLTTIEEVKAYDYTTGYPEKLRF